MVFRRRSSLGLNINRIKHVVDSQQGVVLNVIGFVTLVQSTDTPTRAQTDECETGSKVNGIYLRVEAYATTAGALANIYMLVGKAPGTNITLPNPNVVGASDNKRFVIHQEMVMLEQSVNGNPRTLFNGVIVVPRGYRRNGPDDRLTLFTFAPGVNTSVCVQCHYKEFR